MRIPVIAIFGAACLLITSHVSAAQQGSDACAATEPYQASLFIPPLPYRQKAGPGQFWFGTNRLWTSLPIDGTWKGLPQHSPGDLSFREKMAFYRQGYTVDNDPQPPKLVIKARRLDTDSSSYVLDQPITVWHDDRDHPFIMTGINFGALGCWEIRARYSDDEIRFVIRITQ
jgi:hypothetical protein